MTIYTVYFTPSETLTFGMITLLTSEVILFMLQKNVTKVLLF